MTTESQDLGLTSHPKDGAFSSIVSPSLYWGIRTHTDHRVSTGIGLQGDMAAGWAAISIDIYPYLYPLL